MEGPFLRSGLPPFCLERWQSRRETRARINLSESGVEPPPWEYVAFQAGELGDVDLGYGWTRGSPELRRRISEVIYEGEVDPDDVVVTAGSAEANLAVVLGLVGPGDVVVVDMPNYMQVHGLLQMVGARIVEAWRSPHDGWRLPGDEIARLILDLEPRAVFITNPNNPTGNVDTSSLWDLASAASSTGTILVYDEVYRGLELGEPRAASILEAAHDYEARAISVAGLSKAYGLPGLRIGWAAASDSLLAERVWAAKDYSSISVSRLSEAIAVRMMEEDVLEDLLERGRGIVEANLEAFHRALAGTLEYVEPRGGAFIFARVPGVEDTYTLAEQLFREKGVLVNPGECFDMPGYLRIGLGKADQGLAEEGYREIRRFLEERLEGEKGG